MRDNTLQLDFIGTSQATNNVPVTLDMNSALSVNSAKVSYLDFWVGVASPMDITIEISSNGKILSRNNRLIKNDGVFKL